MFNQIRVIVNPIAGGKKDKKALIEKLTFLLSAPGRRVSIQYTQRSGEAFELSRAAVKENADLVMAVGGDGTVNEVASALVNTGVPIAILPQGSGNGLARTLRITSDVTRAAELINEPTVSLIDVGKANDRYFFMLMGIGFDALIGHKFNSHHARGPLPYFYLGAKEFFKYRPPTIQLEFMNQVVELAPFLITIANAQQFGNNALIAPHAKLNDGFLDIGIVRRLGLFGLLSALPKLFRGRIQDFSGIEFHKTKTARLVRKQPDYINLDGESIFEEAVVNISVLPRCLKVIVPKICPALN